MVVDSLAKYFQLPIQLVQLDNTQHEALKDAADQHGRAVF